MAWGRYVGVSLQTTLSFISQVKIKQLLTHKMSCKEALPLVDMGLLPPPLSIHQGTEGDT
jgi:hypothetical protein